MFCLSILCDLVLTVLVVSSHPLSASDSGNTDTIGARWSHKSESISSTYYQDPLYPRDCQEVYDQRGGQDTASGVIKIQPENAPEPFNVFCNNSIDEGGWTVIQRRVDGSVDFYRTWNEYKHGFGFLQREFWLGNDKISLLTSQKDYELRIDMNNVNGDPYFCKVRSFRISDEWSKYRMTDLGNYLPESTATNDALTRHRNMSFTTYDRDNDFHVTLNCAANDHSAWWYYACDNVDLNSNYFATEGHQASIEWYSLPGGHSNLKFTEMKLRPI